MEQVGQIGTQANGAVICSLHTVVYRCRYDRRIRIVYSIVLRYFSNIQLSMRKHAFIVFWHQNNTFKYPLQEWSMSRQLLRSGELVLYLAFAKQIPFGFCILSAICNSHYYCTCRFVSVARCQRGDATL